MTVAILGAGAFGTALAISMCRKAPVTLWARDASHVDAMRSDGVNAARLPDVALPENLSLTGNIEDVMRCQTLLLAVPMQQLATFVQTHIPHDTSLDVVACCKGFDIATGRGPVTVIADTLPNATSAILTGPSFATDIAAGLPTALTLACTDETAGARLQSVLSTPNLRIYRTTDTKGAELGGALKNVIAIASGAAIGAGLGQSARAAVMTRGFAEMTRLAMHLGAQPETLAGLSGFGDLVLTCTSEQSRNYRLGLSLGRGASFDPATTVEGAATARAVRRMTQAAGLDMPITQTVVDVLDGKVDLPNAMASLLARPLKEE